MAELPGEYLRWMEELLGEEFAAFQAVYPEPAASGLRVNTLKIAVSDFVRLVPFRLQALPWTVDGFQLEANSGELAPGKHPYHAAGLYYLQEPSAMLAVEALDPQPGEHILDLAAAPGGKATHIASRLGGQGLLVANELHPRRAWELAENLERWGVRNAVITNETPVRLAGRLSGAFDRVLLDAPCSGEGMFRKSEAARQDWSREFVRGCALRQSGLLEQAAELVRPGGRLVYATCTFNPLENEGVIEGFLQKHPEYQMIAGPAMAEADHGRPEWSSSKQELLRLALRIWPHRSAGEGHFVAVLERAEGRARWAGRGFAARCPADSARYLEAFVQENLQDWELGGWLHQQGTYLYQIAAGTPDLRGLQVIHPGLWLGEVKTRRCDPAHALAMSTRPGQVRRKTALDLAQAQRYLRGETLEILGEAGWTVVTLGGFPLGWGKRSSGTVKNSYPRGLRQV